MIELLFDIQEIPEHPDSWDLYLHTTGDFRVTVASRTLYREQHFCLVEFAVAASEWIRKPVHDRPDFVYSSIESVDEGLLWVKRADSKWRLGSIHQKFKSTTLFDVADIESALSSYIKSLRSVLPGNLLPTFDALITGEIVL